MGNIDKILAGAQKLMLDEDFNAAVENKARAMNGKPALPTTQKKVIKEEKPIEILSDGREEQFYNNLDKLPDAIKQSFRQTPPITEQAVRVNTLNERMGIPSAMDAITSAPTTSTPTTSVGIDYSLIKTIVNECIRTQLNEIKSGLLTEGAGMPVFRGMKIGDGNKIQFLDSKGNLYEGVLKLKKTKR